MAGKRRVGRGQALEQVVDGVRAAGLRRRQPHLVGAETVARDLVDQHRIEVVHGRVAIAVEGSRRRQRAARPRSRPARSGRPRRAWRPRTRATSPHRGRERDGRDLRRRTAGPARRRRRSHGRLRRARALPAAMRRAQRAGPDRDGAPRSRGRRGGDPRSPASPRAGRLRRAIRPRRARGRSPSHRPARRPRGSGRPCSGAVRLWAGSTPTYQSRRKTRRPASPGRVRPLSSRRA